MPETIRRKIDLLDKDIAKIDAKVKELFIKKWQLVEKRAELQCELLERCANK